MFPRRTPLEDRPENDERNCGKRQADNHRPYEQRCGSGEKRRPTQGGLEIHSVVHVHEVELWREVMRMTQAPKPELILQPQDHRHEGKDHIVESHSYNCGQFAGAKKEGEAKSEQRLQPKQRSEAEEDADRETERDGCRRGLN